MSILLVGYAPALAGIVLAGVVVYYYLLYPLLLSPLAKIPNAHWTSAFSPLWILRIRFRNQELATLNELHEKLGPIVRVGPRDLSVSCYEGGIRTIYGGGFEKPTYFDFFNYYGRDNAFCSLSKHDHSLHRRRISPAYNKSALFGSQQLAILTEKTLFDRLMPKLLRAASSSEPIDVLELSYSLSLDLVTCFLFGYSSGSCFLQEGHAIRHWLEHYEHRYCKEAFWPQELPRLTRFLNMIGIDMLPKEHAQGKQFLEDYMMQLCYKADTASLLAEKGALRDAGDMPVVYQQVKKAVESELKQADPQARRLEVASELFDHMSSAREVLGLVLGYTFHYISQNPAAQDSLRSEFLPLVPSMRISGTAAEKIDNSETCRPRLPHPSLLDNLPYLSAVLKESLRMRPNSTPLPRITPPDRSVTIAGTEGIPPGTRVNSFQWFVHRDPTRWPLVNQWMPERWLSTDGKDGEGSENVLWAFASGPRMCAGSHLTHYLMRYILGVVYSNFTTRVVDDGTLGRHAPGSLEDRLMVKFERI